MSLRRVSVLLIATAALLVAFPSWSGAAGMRNCGGGVRAAIVGCPKAKRIATEYTKTQAHSLQGYTCSSGGGQGRCILDRKIVTFPLG